MNVEETHYFGSKPRWRKGLSQHTNHLQNMLAKIYRAPENKDTKPFQFVAAAKREESITIWIRAQRLLLGAKKKLLHFNHQRISHCFQIFPCDVVPRSSFWELIV